jgi:ankyrin repeat protein
MLACASGSLECVEALFSTGSVDVHQRNNTGMTALMYAVQNKECEDLVKLLVDKYGVDVHAHDDNGWTCLFYAASEGDAPLVDMLIRDYGVHIHRKSFDDGNTCLMIAAMSATNMDVASVLLHYGADVNEVNAEGMTCLMLAAENGLTDMVKFLVDNGADPRSRDHDGLTAMDHAEQAEHEETLCVLEALLDQ